VVLLCFPLVVRGHGLQSMSQHTLFRRPAPPEPARVASESSQGRFAWGAIAFVRSTVQETILIVHFTLAMCSSRATGRRDVICANSPNTVFYVALYTSAVTGFDCHNPLQS
jgi:hypothetical protein